MRSPILRGSPAASIALAGVLTAACGRVNTLERRLVDPAAVSSIDRRSPFLKAHLRDGHVVLLARWSVDTPSYRWHDRRGAASH